MSRAQRLSFLAVAAVIAVVAVVVLTSGGGDDQPESTGASATPTATATATATAAPEETETPTPTPEPKPEVPVVTTNGDVTKLEFEQGDTVRFRVRSTVSDEIHVHGYDLAKEVSPGETVTFSFPATITGIFEIELENAHEQIAQLRVDP